MSDQEVTQIGPDGSRIPASEAEQAAAYDGEPKQQSNRIDPETQIAEDGSRQPTPEGGAEENTEPQTSADLEGTQIAEDGTRQESDEEESDEVGPRAGPGGGPAPDDADTEPRDDGGDDGPTKEELMAKARQLDIPGRSSMDKDQLQAAIEEAEENG